jgi:hypothetical protein
MKFWMRSLRGLARSNQIAMPGLVPGIHVLALSKQEARGWPGRSPAMTKSAAQHPRQMPCNCRFSASSSCFICSSDCIVFDSGGGSGFRFAASSTA